jgi:hypothetical protein
MTTPISSEILELIYHLKSLNITKYERIFVDAIKNRGEYDDHERIMLNCIRNQYIKELRKIYTSIYTAERELTATLSQKIAEEIDKQVLEKILKAVI